MITVAASSAIDPTTTTTTQSLPLPETRATDTHSTDTNELLDNGSSDVVFKSRLPDIEISNNMSLHAYCFERLSEFADRPCLICPSTSKTYTFSETHVACRKAAAGLRSLGISRGDVIMIALPNCPEFVFVFMAASFLGAVVTTANPFYTAPELHKQITASNAKLVVTHSQYVPKFPLSLKMKIITVDDNNDIDRDECVPFSVVMEADELSEEEEKTVVVEAEEAVAMPFSSGTTGLPKGVVLTHKSLITSVAQQVDGDNPNLHLRQDDVVLCVLPLFHIFSLNSVLLCSLRAGAAVLLMHKFEIGALLTNIHTYRVSVAAVVPPLVLALAKNPTVADYDLSSIRLVLSGAAPLGKDLQDSLRARLPKAILGQGYGMTEAGPVLTMCLSFAKYPSPTKPGSCGTVVRNAQLKVVDPQTGRSLGYNQPGEICVRGHQIMKGYLNDPQATTATIDSQGFLHTGDIGYVDDDDELFVVDRLKELIKFKGFQVPPAELEALLLTHPSIADAAAVPQTDDAAGEVPVAFVVRSDGADLTEQDVKDFIAKQVVFYKRLHKVYFVESIPKSPSGKILRKDLRAKLASPTPS